jgi:hypothetical protein
MVMPAASISFLSLPNELLGCIVQAVTLSDLVACAYTCRRLEALVLDLLTREVVWRTVLWECGASPCLWKCVVRGSCATCLSRPSPEAVWARGYLLLLPRMLQAFLELRDRVGLLPPCLVRHDLEVSRWQAGASVNCSHSRRPRLCLTWKGEEGQDWPCHHCASLGAQDLCSFALQDELTSGCGHVSWTFLPGTAGQSLSMSLASWGLSFCWCAYLRCSCRKTVELECFVRQ